MTQDLNRQLEGAEVRVGSCNISNGQSDNNTLCGTVSRGEATGAAPIRFSCPAGTYGQYLFVNLPGTDKVLTLCEVDLMSSPGKIQDYRLQSIDFWKGNRYSEFPGIPSLTIIGYPFIRRMVVHGRVKTYIKKCMNIHSMVSQTKPFPAVSTPLIARECINSQRVLNHYKK